MTALATLAALVRGIPRSVGLALLAGLALLSAWAWHDHRVAAAARKGAQDQQVADRARVAAASAAAAAAQTRLAAMLASKQARISKGTDDALIQKNTDMANRYADLRLRWAADRADHRRPGADAAVAVPAATGDAVDAACAARGWVSFDTAAAAAEAADTAIAKDDAWIAWAAAQQAAWPD